MKIKALLLIILLLPIHFCYAAENDPTAVVKKDESLQNNLPQFSVSGILAEGEDGRSVNGTTFIINEDTITYGQPVNGSMVKVAGIIKDGIKIAKIINSTNGQAEMAAGGRSIDLKQARF